MGSSSENCRPGPADSRFFCSKLDGGHAQAERKTLLFETEACLPFF